MIHAWYDLLLQNVRDILGMSGEFRVGTFNKLSYSADMVAMAMCQYNLLYIRRFKSLFFELIRYQLKQIRLWCREGIH